MTVENFVSWVDLVAVPVEHPAEEFDGEGGGGGGVGHFFGVSRVSMAWMTFSRADEAELMAWERWMRAWLRWRVRVFIFLRGGVGIVVGFIVVLGLVVGCFFGRLRGGLRSRVGRFGSRGGRGLG